MTTDELLAYLFDGKSPPLSRELAGWLGASRRYKSFLTTYRDKIRSKLRNVSDAAGVQDIRAELETAALLLRADPFTLEYEKYTALKQRGPDFTVTYKTHTPFNVEVRRLRAVEMDDTAADARAYKLISVLCDKVGQMPPGIVNLLWLTGERKLAEADLTRATVALRQLADHKSEDFFTRRGFANAAAFLKQYSRLSGIILCESGTNLVWLNPLARHPAPPEILNLIRRLHTL